MIAPGRVRQWGAGPVITHTLIAACSLIFVLSPLSGLNPAYGTGDALLAAQNDYLRRWGVVPDELFTFSARTALTPLTALFIHGSWLHLLGNMLFLYVFGVMTEERMGRAEFTAFYLVCGYLSLAAYAAANASSDQTLVGASGAISGVLGAFLLLFPRARVTSLFPFLLFLPLRFPAWLVLAFWFAIQSLAAHRAGGGPGVAYLAHVAGFALGSAYAWARYRRTTKVSSSPAPATEGDNPP
ncbi:rhomboid family intramembrane serine protease [Streptomyces bambusae]|uniref:rhomboid family intramembrane serine protease n=1 Tax=Streptomyces bambusae TaxID=1550616 RepID=UPI001CFD71F4|nr:rhomboid family intramembrane serine protease [Streptomyces bambusae]MCB5167168.1 rhomboid family intramembrane serine protease [Streptomyces bambusae]